MIGTQDSEENASLELPLPPGFEKVENLMTMPNERLRKSPLVNVIALVKDYQPPIPAKLPGMNTILQSHVIVLLIAHRFQVYPYCHRSINPNRVWEGYKGDDIPARR